MQLVLKVMVPSMGVRSAGTALINLQLLVAHELLLPSVNVHKSK